MNNDNGYMHSYFSKIVYLHIFKPTNVGNVWIKISKSHHFFYFRLTDVSALKVKMQDWIKNPSKHTHIYLFKKRERESNYLFVWKKYGLN